MATPPTFTAGSVLTAAQMNAVGLWKVKAQTIGTAVSSVTVTDAFSADYDGYKIIVSGGNTSTDCNISLRLGASATGYYASKLYLTYATNATFFVCDNNTSTWTGVGYSTNNTGIYMTIDLINPFLAKWTLMTNAVNAATLGGPSSGIHQVATSYSSFVLTPSSGTLTGGTVAVYGYRL